MTIFKVLQFFSQLDSYSYAYDYNNYHNRRYVTVNHLNSVSFRIAITINIGPL